MRICFERTACSVHRVAAVASADLLLPRNQTARQKFPAERVVPSARASLARRGLRIAKAISAAVAAYVCLGAVDVPVAWACTTPVGDITGSGKVNVADTQCIVITTLFFATGAQGPVPSCLSGGQTFVADFNCDGVVNVSDAQLHVQVVLSNPLPTNIDSDGNFCPDSCQTPALGGPPVVIPTYFYGTASGGGLTVRPLAPGSTAVGASSGGGLTVQPKPVGQTGN